MSKNTWGSTKPAKYIVDKKTLHGNYFHLYNDFLGTKEMQIWPSFGNGYYVSNMEPSQLKETLEKELARKDLPSTVRKRTQALVKSLNEDNNNVVLFAKMKNKNPPKAIKSCTQKVFCLTFGVQCILRQPLLFFLSVKTVLSQKRNQNDEKSSILILIAICLFSCSKPSKEASITGEIKGLGTDTLYLYGMDELRDRIDTIFTKDDKFAYTIPVDTITPAFLLINNQIEYPIYLDKGNKIKIKGDISNPEYLHIEGNIYNQEFTAFQEDLRGLGTPSEKVLEQKAEEFIRGHHSSFVSLYLLDKYFVQKDSPDFNKIKNSSK